MSAWVDKLSNVTFTSAQLEKRYDALIQSKFPLRKERAMNRKAFGQIKGKYIPTDTEIADEVLYEQLTKDIRLELEEAKLDNELLCKVIEHEKAEQRLNKYILSEGVKEVLEVKDGDEVIQPGIKMVEPLPLTVDIDIYGEEGNFVETVTGSNPVIVQDEMERKEAQATIDSADIHVLSLLTERKELGVK